MSKAQAQAICKSVFKSGESTVLKKKLTKAFIDIINKSEKAKSNR